MKVRNPDGPKMKIWLPATITAGSGDASNESVKAMLMSSAVTIVDARLRRLELGVPLRDIPFPIFEIDIQEVGQRRRQTALAQAPPAV